jgi:hypothetical protein
MPAWITITLADLNDYLVGAQVTAINTAARASGQTDRFTGAMTDAVNRIRLKIASCKSNQLSATPLTVPPELKMAACYFTIESMQAAIPGLKLTDDQKKKIEVLNTDLNRIADCKDVVSKPEDPENPSEAQRGASFEKVSGETRRATRGKLSGL